MTVSGRQSVILAVDIGTSGARAVLFDARANHQSRAGHSYGMLYPHHGWNEQSPETVLSAVLDVLRQSVAGMSADAILEGIVLSSQMYSVLAVDPEGRPLSNSLTWGDSRAASLAAEVRGMASPDLPGRTGCPIQAIYPLSKILWLKRSLGLPKATRFLSIKDYVIYRLTGEFVSDCSISSATGLLNITGRTWDDEALALCGIRSRDLPELVSPRHIIRRWRSEISQYIGIPTDLPLIMGAGDAPLANIGVGAIDPGTIAVNLGTSAAARVLLDKPKFDSAGRLWTYIADDDRWAMGGIIGSGGATYEWLLRELLFKWKDLSSEQLFQEADRLAESVPPGASGLLFVPYISGEQSPGWNSQMQGALYGMALGQEARHQIRAAIEGIAFSLFSVADLIQQLQGISTEKVYLTGGLAASPVWSQVIADVFDASVIVPPSPESSARGAAIVGWMALGLANGYASFVQPEVPRHPDKQSHAIYSPRFTAFMSLINHLRQFLADQEISND